LKFWTKSSDLKRSIGIGGYRQSVEDRFSLKELKNTWSQVRDRVAFPSHHFLRGGPQKMPASQMLDNQVEGKKA
jgi:hypothetical protein